MSRARLAGVVLGSPDPRRLAGFYEQLLGLVRLDDEDDWVRIGSGPGDRPSLAFQREAGYRPPVWPSPGRGDQQLHQHLDVAVADLAAEMQRAVGLGARVADHQPQDDVRVMLDPDGHVFCLFHAPEAARRG